MSPVIISIDGNIGSGKSTLVKLLSDDLKNNNKVCFLQEPIDIWNSITDENGKTILSHYYADQKKYAFSFQMMAFVSRLSLLREAMTKEYDYIITERCMITDKMVFAKMLYDEGKIEEIEYNIYNKWFDEFNKDFPNIKIVYVKTTPEIAKLRVDKRAREGEIIPLEYLKNCHHYHDTWLNNYDGDIVTLNADVDTEIYPTYNINMIKIIKDFMNLQDDSYIHTIMRGSRGN